jgi:hypothetical protein
MNKVPVVQNVRITAFVMPTLWKRRIGSWGKLSDNSRKQSRPSQQVADGFHHVEARRRS